MKGIPLVYNGIPLFFEEGLPHFRRGVPLVFKGESPSFPKWSPPIFQSGPPQFEIAWFTASLTAGPDQNSGEIQNFK